MENALTNTLMKSNKYLFSLLLLVSLSGSAQKWIWGRPEMNGIYSPYAYGFATAVFGNNTYFGGAFQDTITFGPNILISNNYESAFLAKYDFSGKLIWAIQSKGGSNTECKIVSVATDKWGNIYATGTIWDTVSFGAYTIQANNSGNAFLIKFDSTGNVIWARASTTPSLVSQTLSNAVTTDHNGNAYITGYFRDTVSFGSYLLRQPWIGNINVIDVFTVKYDSAGNVIWAQNAIDHALSGSTEGFSVATDMSDNVYVCGTYNDTVTFDTITLCGDGCGCGFLVKYSPSGSVVWVKRAIGEKLTHSSYAAFELYAVTTDNLNGVYVTGDAIDIVYLGTDTLSTTTSSTAPVLFKYDTNGVCIWKESANVPIASNYWRGYSLSADNANHIFLASCNSLCTGTPYYIKFASDSFYVLSTGNYPSLLNEFEASTGKPICGSEIAGGGGWTTNVNGVTTDPTGNYIFMAGSFNNGVTQIFGSDTIGSNSNYRPFLARWQPCEGNPSSMDNLSVASSVTLFPDPNNGRFTLGLNNITDKCIVEFYNVLGEKIYSQTVSQTQNEHEINLGYRALGIYLYRVMTEEGKLIYSDKFIIQQ